MSSVEIPHHLVAGDQEVLLYIAERAIESGLAGRVLPHLDPRKYSPALQEPGASFVTLRVYDSLRGCVGTLEPHTALVADVWRNAFRSAFRDLRFSPMTREEFDQLTITVSVLGPTEEIQAASQAEAIRQLRPGVHGVILQSGSHVATFLPSVWNMVEGAHQFMRQLLAKAGLPSNDWPSDMCVERYTVQKFQLDRERIGQPI